MILDSKGNPVRLSTRRVAEAMDGGKGFAANPGRTLMSRFSGNASSDLAKFKKLAADIDTANPSIRSPLLNQSNFYMPENDSSTGEPNRLMNQWITYYLKWSGIVGNAISLHSTLGSTLILTPDGVKPISDFVGKEQVLSNNGCWQSVHWAENHEFIGDLVEVSFYGANSEFYTHNHPILVARGGKLEKTSKDGQKYFAPCVTGSPDFISAIDIKKGDYVLYPKFNACSYFRSIDLVKYIPSFFNSQNQEIYSTCVIDNVEFITNTTGPKRYLRRYIPITSELAELIGWYVAEGSSSFKNGRIEFSLNATKDPITRLCGLIKKLFYVEPTTRIVNNCCRLTITSSILARFLSDVCGSGAENKKIPDFIYANDKTILKSFFVGYLGGDGFISKQHHKGGYVYCCTVSKTLAYQIRAFGTKLGILFNIKNRITKRVKDHGLKSELPLWHLACSLILCSEALFDKKIEQTKTPVKIKQDDKFFYIPVKKISVTKYSGLVYDIKTDDKTFITNMIVHNSELPLSRFALRGITDKKILQFYEDMVESMELHVKSVNLLHNYFAYGEVIPFAYWSDTYNCFTDLTFLDSNYVYVKGHYLLHSDEGEDTEFYELEPDPLLINIVKSDDYVTKMMCAHLGEEFIEAVRQNKRLLLSNFSTHMIRNKLKWGDLRGTSIILRCLKSLLYSDKLREATYSVADGHINPKWIWKIGQAGDLTTGGYMPSEEDLQAFRDLLISASNDPLFTIITHYAVNVEAVGLNGKLLPITQELQQVEKEVMTALFTNEALTNGQGPNFATASVAFRALMSRYIPIRAKLERYYYQKIFAPVAYANKFFERKQADLAHRVRTGDDDTNKLIIPTIDWRSKSNLLDDGTIKSIISSMVGSGRLPMKVLVDALDLDYNEVRDYLWSEQATVFDAVTLEARKKMAATNTDETMLGQPYAPKTNQPVSMKTAKGQAAPAKVAKANKHASGLLLSPLRASSDPIQTQIDKGKPERGGNPKTKDPVAEAVALEPLSATAREFDGFSENTNYLNTMAKVIGRSYDRRKVDKDQVLRPTPATDTTNKSATATQ